MEKIFNVKTKLGFGFMRLPRLADGKTIDVETTSRMVDRFLEAGGTYFDTAFIYEGSEAALKASLIDRHPRESFQVATKLHTGQCPDEASAKEEFRISLERTGAGYFDYYLLHSLGKDRAHVAEDFHLWEFLQEMKEKGLVRHFGFSFHGTPEILDSILTRHPEAEFVQLQINYADWEDSSIQAKRCYEIAEKHGKPIVVMEPVKGGTLADPPESVLDIFRKADPDASPASWGIRFAASLPQTAVVLSGMSAPDQMEDNLSFMKDFRPLSEAEMSVIREAQEALKKVNRIGCTGCNYCTPGCPMEIRIPDIFSVMNINLMYGKLDTARNSYTWRIGPVKASECIKCGQCESVCPQQLPVIRLLEETAEALE